MEELFFGYDLDYSGRVTITPVKCADGNWRWCVSSFEDVVSDTPALLSSPDPTILFNTTDEMEHPEMYDEELKEELELDKNSLFYTTLQGEFFGDTPLDLEDSDWIGDMGDV